MSNELKRIPFKEFSENLDQIFDQVISEGESIVVEKGEGERVALIPASSLTSPLKTEEDWAEFRAAAGSWADVDIDAFLKDVHESRRSSRPPVSL